MYRIGGIVHVDDSFQRAYAYEIAAPPGADVAPGFAPHFTPAELPKLGVFEGKYCNDCGDELPAAWFAEARTAARADPTLDRFAIKSRQPLSLWREKNWIVGHDPRQLRGRRPRLPPPPAPGPAALVARPVHLKHPQASSRTPP